MKTIIGLFDDPKKLDRMLDSLLEDEHVGKSQMAIVGHRDTIRGEKGNLETLRKHENDLLMTPDPDDLIDELNTRGVPQDDAEFFAEGLRRGGSLVVMQVDDDRAPRMVEFLRQYETVAKDERLAEWRKRGYDGYDYGAKDYSHDELTRNRREGERAESRTDGGSAQARVPIAEENLQVGKREVDKGGVRVETEVEETPVREEVTLHKENIDVDRRQARGHDGDLGDAFQEKSIEVSEHDEELVVSKEAEIVEEVVVTKESEEVTETVEDTLRRTKVNIEGIDEATGQRGYARHEPDFKMHCTKTYGEGEYGQQRDAYRFGFAHGTHENYRDIDFDQAEPHMRRGYESRYGKGTWAGSRDAARHAFNRGKRALT